MYRNRDDILDNGGRGRHRGGIDDDVDVGGTMAAGEAGVDDLAVGTIALKAAGIVGYGWLSGFDLLLQLGLWWWWSLAEPGGRPPQGSQLVGCGLGGRPEPRPGPPPLPGPEPLPPELPPPDLPPCPKPGDVPSPLDFFFLGGFTRSLSSSPISWQAGQPGPVRTVSWSGSQSQGGQLKHNSPPVGSTAPRGSGRCSRSRWGRRGRWRGRGR